MDFVYLTGGVDFRALVDALETGIYDDLGDGSGRKFIDLPGLGLYATVMIGPTGRTIFTIRDESSVTVTSIDVDQRLDLDQPRIGLKEALYAQDGTAMQNFYSVTDEDAQLTTFATDDTVMISAGKLNAAAGDDRVLVLDAYVDGTEEYGAGPKAVVKGGEGADKVYVSHFNANINTGDGDDTIVVGWGKAVLRGGAGSDTFSVDSTIGDTVGSAVERDLRVEADIRDFQSGIDGFVFQTMTKARGRVPADRDLGDIFEGVTLADLGPTVTIDGLTYSFSETGAGDAVIARTGESARGASVDEIVTFKGLGLADISLEDITIHYATDAYAFLL